MAFTYRLGMVIAEDDDERRAYLKAFGMSLKVQRVKRGLSQDQFGDLIGLHRGFIGQLERGERGCNIVELPKIARALGVRQGEVASEAAGLFGSAARSRRPVKETASSVESRLGSRYSKLHGAPLADEGENAAISIPLRSGPDPLAAMHGVRHAGAVIASLSSCERAQSQVLRPCTIRPSRS